MQELYRQPIRISDQHVTMLDMVSDLTGVVRGYYKNWKRPLAARKEDLYRAKKLGNTIVRVASQRAWRECALQNVLQSLYVQDRQMHQLVTNILTDARASLEIAKHKDLHDQLQDAFQKGDQREIWDVSRQLYRRSNQTLDFLEMDSINRTAFSSKLERVKNEDPVMHRRILVTLDEVAASRSESTKNKVPR